MKKKKNLKHWKKRVNEFFKTLKPILILSFIINFILLIYSYCLKSSDHFYIMGGENEYLAVKSGVVSLNSDVNCLVGNNIEYIGEEDIKIKELKIGYYILDGENLKEIISHYAKFEESVSLYDTISDITSLNVSESANKKEIFNNLNSDIENDFYLVMEIKNEKGEKTVSKLQLDVSKIK